MSDTHPHTDPAAPSSPRLGRRGVLAAGGAMAAAGVLGALPTPASADTQHRYSLRDMPLSFNGDGRFKIVQFNDTQDDHLTDRRTIELMGRVLDQEKPNFALINGDVINGGPATNRQVYQAINNVVMPMESRGIPWALTFGNHDEDSSDDGRTSVREPQIVGFVRQYRHNLNPAIREGLFGSCNGQLLIKSARGDVPAFGIWLLDSGRYAPERPGGQSRQGLMGYDWIRPEQIRWYSELSADTERKYRKKVPSLMFFHIPLFEHHHMWYGQQFTSNDAGHAEAVRRHGIVGVKNEGVYTGLVNSGMYAAAFERGDVLGIYCGHDHINTFMGNYFGIELGYGPGTGFGTYGLNDGTWEMHTLRGARVFELDEANPRVYADTRLVFAKDLGLDMNPAPQKLAQPADFPAYVRPVN